MARPRKQTYVMSQYLSDMKEGYILNDADTQRNPAWKPIVDGLAVTILTDDYIPAIILAEESSGQQHIVDGGSRSAAFSMIRYGNYKIKAVEDSVISYKAMKKNKDGEIIWEDETFDIKNKTFEQFPKELQKKFDSYQVETVIHECDSNGIAKYLKRYNMHTSMNTHQKMFMYIPNFAKQIRKITEKDFFIEKSCFTDNEKGKGVLERTVLETAMCMFHLDKWNKTWKNNPSFLNENASIDEFQTIDCHLDELENIVNDKTKILFNSKNTFIWITLFDKFSKLGLENKKFSDFLEAFVDELQNHKVNGKLFGEVDNEGSTKDKSIIISKLHILETLMNEYFEVKELQMTTEEFVSEMVKLPIDEVKNDMSLYEESLEYLEDNNIRDGSKLLNDENKPSMLAMVAWSYKNDIDLDNWIKNYALHNNMYYPDQKKNFLHMVNDIQDFVTV